MIRKLLRDGALILFATLLCLELSAWILRAVRPNFAFTREAPKKFSSPLELPESLSAVARPTPNTIAPSETPVTRPSGAFMAYEQGLWIPPKASTFRNQFFRADGALARENIFSTDFAGRRENSFDLAKKHVRSHLFAFGCSITWGYGLDNDQTFLAELSRLTPALRTYNGAFEGYGPAENLWRAKTTNLLEGIKPIRGVGVYFYFREHFSRFWQGYQNMDWRDQGLVLEEGKPGEFTSLGSVRDQRPYWVIFSRLLKHEQISSLLGLELPAKTPARLATMARALDEIRRQYRAHTAANNPFVVVLLPFGDVGDDTRRALSEAGLPYIDYSTVDLSRILTGPGHLAGDPHPDVEFQKVFSAALARDLRAFLP